MTEHATSSTSRQPKPELTIGWTSAGSHEQDEALVDEIVEFAMGLLSGYDCWASGSLDPKQGDDPCDCGQDTVEGCAERPAKHCGNFQ